MGSGNTKIKDNYRLKLIDDFGNIILNKLILISNTINNNN